MQKNAERKTLSQGRSKERLQREMRMKKTVRAHLRDVRIFRALGFRYDSARGGRFVIDEEEFFKVASA